VDKYIGVKMIEAKAMNLGDYNKYRGWQIPADEDPAREGFLVKYEDGYVSWSPATVFEKAYRKFGNDKNTVTQEDVDGFIVNAEAIQLGDKTTVVKATLANGFILVESSTCVDGNNFDMKIGTECCMSRIKDNVWFLLGFLLQCGTDGLNK